MNKELYDKIIQNFTKTTNKSILDKISDIQYAELGGYSVIEVYIKESMKVSEMGEVLTNIEDYAKENNYAVVVDFLRGQSLEKMSTMSKELYDKMIQNFKETINKSILDKISNIQYAEVDDYQVIQIYIKESMKVLEMGEVLINIEDYAKENNCSVVVDFLRG